MWMTWRVMGMTVLRTIAVTPAVAMDAIQPARGATRRAISQGDATRAVKRAAWAAMNSKADMLLWPRRARRGYAEINSGRTGTERVAVREVLGNICNWNVLRLPGLRVLGPMMTHQHHFAAAAAVIATTDAGI